MQNKELKFIEIIKNSLDDPKYLGDDCANLNDFGLCVSSDLLVEDVHFTLASTTPELLARKALKVNISDVLASGAKPMYITVCISGKLTQDFISKFYNSLNASAKEFDVKVIGGDLTGGQKLTVSITAFGSSKGRNISSRKNARPGYILALCGEFGTSAVGLREILENPKADTKASIVHRDPILHPFESETIAKNTLEPYAMMDSSDGLINALNWLKRSSNAGFEVNYDSIPKAFGANKNDVLFGGEDYSLVIAMSKDDFKRVEHLETIVKAGIVTTGDSIKIDGTEIKNTGEFLHFD